KVSYAHDQNRAVKSQPCVFYMFPSLRRFSNLFRRRKRDGNGGTLILTARFGPDEFLAAYLRMFLKPA
ncbi:MAG: hypothetical protein AAGU05_02570, partial [Anaerolineaceae bacterium]